MGCREAKAHCVSCGQDAVPLAMSTLRLPLLLLGAVFALGALCAGSAAARQLHWSSVEVSARLDADGRLHVVERQAMVFDGDWNGGERRFDVNVLQKLDFQGLARIDPQSGQRVEVLEGDIERVDRYAWFENKTLRWRSRRPADPVFRDQTLVYELTYTLAPVLVFDDGVYRFDHDFVFVDRVGEIERLVVDFELDPAWRSDRPLPGHFEREHLPPGRSAVLEAELTYLAEGRPGFVLRRVPASIQVAAFLAALAAIAWLYLRLRRHEASRGRFEQAEIPQPLDPAWLDEHLFDLRPEEVGALWDRRVGAPEVAAVIARLVGEGKLGSSVVGKRNRDLALELKAERIAFESYERKLVDKLFFDGRTETDTKAVRKHYRGKGFDPAAIIRGPITRRLRARTRAGDFENPPKDRWPLWLALGFLALLALEGVARGAGVLAVLGVLLVMTPLPVIVGSVFTGIYRMRTRHLTLTSLGFLLPAVAMASLLLVFGTRFEISDFYPSVFGVLALFVVPVFLTSVWTHLARTKETAKAMARRQRLGAIRRFFAGELRRDAPALDDAWFPYLLAFGLDKNVDRWFRSHGAGLGAVGSASTGAASSSFGSSGSGTSWTGGGGHFGGAGATAAWATAATGLAAGVARPGSSGGGGSSSSGGSFSGGGGGGGW